MFKPSIQQELVVRTFLAVTIHSKKFDGTVTFVFTSPNHKRPIDKRGFVVSVIETVVNVELPI